MDVSAILFHSLSQLTNDIRSSFIISSPNLVNAAGFFDSSPFNGVIATNFCGLAYAIESLRSPRNPGFQVRFLFRTTHLKNCLAGETSPQFRARAVHRASPGRSRAPLMMAGRLLGCGPRTRKPQSPPKHQREIDESSESSTGMPDNMNRLTWKDLKYLAKKKGDRVLQCAEIDKKTRLWLAAEIGAVKEVERALAAGELTVSDKNPDGSKLIHVCAYVGAADVVKKLLEMGEEVNVTNDTGETPLFMAAAGGYSQLVRHLISIGADINKPNIYFETPLYMACYQGHVEVVRAMVRARGLLVSAANEEGIQALDIARRYATSSPQHKVIVQIIERAAVWSRIRLIYIGHLKNKENPNCPFRLLSVFAIRTICEYVAKSSNPVYGGLLLIVVVVLLLLMLLPFVCLALHARSAYLFFLGARNRSPLHASPKRTLCRVFISHLPPQLLQAGERKKY